jgi:hypothetical protein
MCRRGIGLLPTGSPLCKGGNSSLSLGSVSSAYSVEDRLNADSLAQHLFHEAVAEVGERGKGVLPECHDRIELAV